MKEVIRIDKKKENDKPVEFTHYFDEDIGCVRTDTAGRGYDKIIYLGRCSFSGDMFAAYNDGKIYILKGHLNSGKILKKC